MPSRYQRDNVRSDGRGYNSPGTINTVRQGIENGDIEILKTILLTQGDRLDTIAGTVYGDARFWWAIAAASNIGWGMQVPPGTIIKVPNMKDVERLIG
jgi:nucleoid-associated protein YgaU